MADAVERLMEDMLPELEDLVKRELFSQVNNPCSHHSELRLLIMCLLQDEIRSTIKKRRDFEYTLKRRKLER